MSGTKGGEELYSIAWQQVIICQWGASTCHQPSHTETPSMERHWGTASVYPRGPEVLRQGCQGTQIQSAPWPSLGRQRVWWLAEKPLRFLGLLGFDTGSRRDPVGDQRSCGLPAVIAWLEITFSQADGVTASPRSLLTFNHYMAQIFQNIVSLRNF